MDKQIANAFSIRPIFIFMAVTVITVILQFLADNLSLKSKFCNVRSCLNIQILFFREFPNSVTFHYKQTV